MSEDADKQAEALCPFCESEISPTVKKCRHCGEWVSRDCLKCGTPIKAQWAARGLCADCEGVGVRGLPMNAAPGSTPVAMYPGMRKSRTTSVGLGLVFGGIGAHKFYLDRPGMGLLYAAFCWTGIPSLIGIFEAVKYIRMDEEEFQRRSFAKDL